MNNTFKIGKMNAYGFQVGKSDIHVKTQRDSKDFYYLCTWSIRNFSSVQNTFLSGFYMEKGISCGITLSVDEGEVIVTIEIKYGSYMCLKQGVAILTDTGVVLFQKTLDQKMKSTCSITGEDLQKLKQLTNDTLVLTYRLIFRQHDYILKNMRCNTAINNAEYLKSLEADVKKYSSFLKEKVSLRVGQETEVVNKAVLCARSSVFAKKFDDDMSHKNNTIVITDIKMPVLRAVISFLCSGHLPDRGFDFLCELYKTAIKYDIWELHQGCVKYLYDKITNENLIHLLKLSSANHDELLKSVAMTLICANIETVTLTPAWKDLMCDDPELALKASTFFDI